MQSSFHTLDAAPEDRIDYWRGAMAAELLAVCTVEPARGRAFDAWMGSRDCGGLEVLEVKGTPYRSARHGPGRAGWVSLMFQIDGIAVVADRRREARLGPGDACIVPADREIVAERLTPFHQVLLDVRVDDLSQALPGWRALQGRRLDGALAGVAATGGLLRFIVAHHERLTPPSRDHLGETTLQLLSDLTGAPPAPATRRGPAQHAARRQRERAERFITDNLHDGTLSVALIARELGISKRYLHALFRDGMNVMQWVMERRLQACHREIAAHDGRSIAEVAYSWGFNSPAHFCRVFHRRFGVRPSDL